MLEGLGVPYIEFNVLEQQHFYLIIKNQMQLNSNAGLFESMRFLFTLGCRNSTLNNSQIVENR